MPLPNLLFNQYDVSLVLRGREEAVRQKIQTLPPDRFLDESDLELIPALIAEFQLNVPVLKRVEKQSDSEVRIPFEGDVDFFNVLPQTFSSVPNWLSPNLSSRKRSGKSTATWSRWRIRPRRSTTTW
jgi:hypothetical protein